MVSTFMVFILALNPVVNRDTVVIVLKNKIDHVNRIFIVKPQIREPLKIVEQPMVLNLPIASRRIQEKKKLSLYFRKNKKMAFVYANDYRTLQFLNNKDYEVYVYRLPEDSTSDLIRLSSEYHIHFYNGVPSFIELLGIKYLPALVEVKGDEAIISYGCPY